MSPWMSWLILATYYLALGGLALYGLHRLVVLGLYYRYRRRPVTVDEPVHWQRVTVQLPIFNEMYVAERLVDAVCRLDYPRELLEIQVLDDSTDETSTLLHAAVERHRLAGVDIKHLHRDVRTGYKAGALAAGLEVASGEFLAVFDADFVPAPDFLRQTVPHFADPEVGMVQARWEHINREYSLLTRVQAVLLDGHFVIEHVAREGSGCFFNFNGTAGVWRRQAILDAGGWEHDTLTEDLDLSYRAQLAGWRFRYLPDVIAPAELPVDINAFKRQQFRWAKGSIQTARKLLGPIFAARLPWHTKLEAFVHLTNNAAYLLMIPLSLLVFPAMLLRRQLGVDTLARIDLPLLVAATGSVLLFYIASQRRRHKTLPGCLRQLPALMGLGIGLAVNNGKAVISGLMHDGGVFERTPKYRIERRLDTWQRKQYRAGRDSSWAVEGLFALYLGLCCVLGVAQGLWLSLPFLYLFFYGFSTMFLLSILPSGGVLPRKRSRPLPVRAVER